MQSIEPLLADLVAYDSVSANGNRALMDALAERCAAAGARVALQGWGEGAGAKANLVAVLGPDEPKGLILSGHADVVPFADQPGWTRDPLRLAADGDRLFARGTSDMKGFLAQCLAALPGIDAARLARPLVLLFTADEEIGCLGAERLAAALPELLGATPMPRLAWIGEPTSGRVFHAHKGIVDFTIRVSGRGGHSSIPEAGANAIAGAAEVAARLGRLQAERRARPSARFAELFPEAPYTTFNLGTIRGGSATNMIAETCTLNVSYRPLPDEDPLALWHEARARLQGEPLRDPGSERALTVEVLPALAAPGLLAPRGTPLEAELLAEFGGHAVGGAPYCTDAGRFAVAGIDSLICGPGDLAEAHQPNESISRKALAHGIEPIVAIVSRLCGRGGEARRA
ncbi:MAG TPA: acetylornithine deacetylase [Myxococcota bacterium]